MIGSQTAFDWTKWLENQGPLWVIYALVILGLISLGRMALKYIPIILAKHIEMLTVATETMAKCATSFEAVKAELEDNSDRIREQTDRFSDAAKPFANAIEALAHADNREAVRLHLNEMVLIMKSGT